MEHITNTQNGIRSIIQKQIHSSSINIVDRNTPLWQHADAMITTEENLALVTFGADCCIIAFWKDDKIGVCHAGWQGYSLGLIKKMAKEFIGGECYIGPFLHMFEIKKDHAYKAIAEYYGEKFIHESGNKIFFDFRTAVRNEIFEVRVNEDPRSTFETSYLASRRREHSVTEKPHNKLLIWRTGDNANVRLLRPDQNYKEFLKNFTLQQ